MQARRRAAAAIRQQHHSRDATCLSVYVDKSRKGVKFGTHYLHLGGGGGGDGVWLIGPDNLSERAYVMGLLNFTRHYRFHYETIIISFQMTYLETFRNH